EGGTGTVRVSIRPPPTVDRRAWAGTARTLPRPFFGDTLYVAILVDPPIVHTEHSNDSILAGLADHLAERPANPRAGRAVWRHRHAYRRPTRVDCALRFGGGHQGDRHAGRL